MAQLLPSERIEEIRHDAESLPILTHLAVRQMFGQLLGHIDALQEHWDATKHSYLIIEEGYTKLIHRVQDDKEAIRTLRAALEEVLEYASHTERDYGPYLIVHGFDPPFPPEAEDIGIRARRAIAETSQYEVKDA